MSLGDYDYLPKVSEDAPSLVPQKTDSVSLGTPKSLKLTIEREKSEDRGSLNGSGYIDETEQLLTSDPLNGLVSDKIVSAIKKASSQDWDTLKSPKNLTLSSTISRSPGHSTYVRTPLPGNCTKPDSFLKPTDKSHFLRDQFVSAALRSAQNVPEERLRREKDLKQLKRNIGAVVPLKGFESDETSIGCFGKTLVFLCYTLILCFFPIAIIFCLRVIQEYERAVIFRLGRITKGGAWGPGLCFHLPCLDQITVVDMRTLSFAVPPQEALTRDSVTVSVDAAVYFRISSPIASVCNVEDVEQSSRLLAQTTLRNIIGTRSLNELLAEREEISNNMQQCLDTATEPWGVVVERVEIKDVRLPSTMQRAMAAEAEAYREARAKEIAAGGERNAAGALKEAADKMMQSPCSIQLRYLQTLNNIATGSGHSSTILFPIPMELLNLKQQDLQSQPIYQNVKQ